MPDPRIIRGGMSPAGIKRLSEQIRELEGKTVKETLIDDLKRLHELLSRTRTEQSSWQELTKTQEEVELERFGDR